MLQNLVLRWAHLKTNTSVDVAKPRSTHTSLVDLVIIYVPECITVQLLPIVRSTKSNEHYTFALVVRKWQPTYHRYRSLVDPKSIAIFVPTKHQYFLGTLFPFDRATFDRSLSLPALKAIFRSII